MICFQVTNLPNIGDRVKYNGRSYQIISDLKDSQTKGISWAEVVHISKGICWEKRFYFELILLIHFVMRSIFTIRRKTKGIFIINSWAIGGGWRADATFC